MEEAQATYCFCGCGARVKNPRLVVTNANGWDLSDELAEWAKLQIFASRTGMDLAGGDLADNLASGQDLWGKLREAIHSDERADKENEKEAAVWRKRAKKARRKLSRQFRRDGLPDPFDFPNLGAKELAAWIIDGTEPAWTAELDGEGREENGPAARLVEYALSLQAAGEWEWDEIPGIAIAKTADQLSHFREEYNLVLDAIALGYWIRRAEPELTDGINTFDANYIVDLREKFAASDEPDTIITIAMNQVREGLPEPFAQGPEAWSEVVEVAVHVLTIRGESLLSEQPDFDEDGQISDELREFALSLGYGLAMTVDALGIDGTRARQG
jgi:hypothetical protein